jgi:hypothetical protein
MFDSIPTPEEGNPELTRGFSLAKLATIFAVVLTLSFGLCGSQFYFQPDAYVTIEGMIGFAGLLVSIPGLAVVCLIGIARSIRSYLRSRKDSQ